MRVAQINVTCGKGSTGKICESISRCLDEKGIENKVFFASGDCGFENGIAYSTPFLTKVNALLSRVFGNYGFNARWVTRRLIRKLKRFSPDVVHLHNLHGHNANLALLFRYLKKNKIRVVWTFHDCWAFTAYCPHFTVAKCDKWKTGCNRCPQVKGVSWFFDRSKTVFNRKKKAILGSDLTIVTPSQWLADLVKQSFLKDCPVKVIHNGIDLSVFKPTESDFRERYRIPKEKYLVLGVAFGWGFKKGLDVFIELSKRLPEQYQIVLVGTNEQVDKQLPQNVISIHRTQNQTELAEIYTAADLFVNPTREENYPTVNMESLACGTPVLTFLTGGSPEIIDDTCGRSVECDDIDEFESKIIQICSEKVFDEKTCCQRATSFDRIERYKEYIGLYGQEGVL